jgi:uncharacterized protein (UPF0548 family)
MISLRPPSAEEMRELLRAHSDAPFSYAEVGATRGAFPASYTQIHRAAVLGRGEAAFHTAKNALVRWASFELSWVRPYPQAAPAKGILIAIVVHVAGLWWKNVSRVIYTVDETGAFGFAYGTLSTHAERGEELFRVELSPETEEVTYRIQAFARPRHPLARLAAPLARATQRRFGNDSIAAMRRQVAATGPSRLAVTSAP